MAGSPEDAPVTSSLSPTIADAAGEHGPSFSIIEDARAKIDHIDDQLVELLLERFELVGVIHEQKEALGLPVRDFARQGQILERVTELVGGKQFDGIFRMILDVSSQAQGETPPPPPEVKRSGLGKAW